MTQIVEMPNLALHAASSSKFSIWVEESKIAHPELSYLQIICQYADVHGCEYEDLATLISITLKQKIYQEAKTEYSMSRTTPIAYNTACIE
jgi:hypothetical protein